MSRPEYPNCVMTPGMIRGIREDQEMYDRGPEHYEMMQMAEQARRKEEEQQFHYQMMMEDQRQMMQDPGPQTSPQTEADDLPF